MRTSSALSRGQRSQRGLPRSGRRPAQRVGYAPAHVRARVLGPGRRAGAASIAAPDPRAASAASQRSYSRFAPECARYVGAPSLRREIPECRDQGLAAWPDRSRAPTPRERRDAVSPEESDRERGLVPHRGGRIVQGR